MVARNILFIKQKLSNINDAILKHLQSFLTPHQLENFKNNNFIDFKEIDFLSENVKIEIVLETINWCNIAPIGNDVKIILFKNIENAKPLICNSMLKFLENLPTYLYAIFTTQNEHLVLSTIKSRLQICKVFADNKNLNDLNLNPDEMKIFTFVFDDINDGKNNLENNFFNTALQNAKTIIKNEINKIFQIFAWFETLNNFEVTIFLKILVYLGNKYDFLNLLNDYQFVLSKQLFFNKILLLCQQL